MAPGSPFAGGFLFLQRFRRRPGTPADRLAVLRARDLLRAQTNRRRDFLPNFHVQPAGQNRLRFRNAGSLEAGKKLHGAVVAELCQFLPDFAQDQRLLLPVNLSAFDSRT